MYHIYKDGYSVLPALKKLGEGKTFQVTMKDYDDYIEQKQKALEEQICFVEFDISPEIYEPICEFIVSEYPMPIQKPHSFENIAVQIQEDIAIFRVEEGRNWLASGFICFPSGWRPEDKIGKDFEEIHKPVPGMALTNSQQIAESMIKNGPFERYVWTPVFEKEINFHPRRKKAKFDKENPCVHVKVERQIIHGFPEINAALFVMRQFLIPEEEIDKEALAKSIQAMSWNEKKYKGLTQKGRALSLDVCDYLTDKGIFAPDKATVEEVVNPYAGTPEYDGYDGSDNCDDRYDYYWGIHSLAPNDGLGASKPKPPIPIEDNDDDDSGFPPIYV